MAGGETNHLKMFRPAAGVVIDAQDSQLVAVHRVGNDDERLGDDEFAGAQITQERKEFFSRLTQSAPSVTFRPPTQTRLWADGG